MSAARPLKLTQLHALAAGFDLLALLLILAQALFFTPAAAADRRVLWLSLAVVPIAFLLFALMPRRVLFQPETEVARRSLMVYASLGLPLVAGLLTLVLVGVSRSFDSFAGFALLIAADGGRNLWEWLMAARRS